jgi:hypothetical protein
VIWQNGWQHFEPTFTQRPLDGGFSWLRRPGAPISDKTIDPYWGEAPMLRALVADRATFNCYETLKLIQVADPDKPLLFSDDPTRVERVSFTPNRIDVSLLPGTGGTRLFVNQSYAAGWHSTLGAVTPDARYQNITVLVPERAGGSHSIAFTPPGLAAGFVIMALAAGASGWLMKTGRRTSAITADAGATIGGHRQGERR